MIIFEEAFKLVIKNALPLPPERSAIEDAVGKVILEDVYCGLDMPPFDKSAVDGYAVRAADLGKTPAVLRSSGLIQAGEVFKGRLSPGECVKIMTGAPLPNGADSVVMVEETTERGGLVKFPKVPSKGANICKRGEDIRKGAKILPRGTMITVAHIAVLAAAGRSHVVTGASPRVALINTGGEIAPPGSRLRGNHIYNSNGPMLAALLKSDGLAAEPVIVRDDAGKLKAAFSKALKADVVLISGGVSMGDYDLVPGVLAELGVRKIFHKVRMKPGKPLFFGRKGRTLVFGIPGNPVSNFLAYLAFVRPALLSLSGRADHSPEYGTGVCAGRFEPRTSRKAFVLSKTVVRNGRRFLRAVPGNGSADILALARADSFTVVDESKKFLKRNEKARFLTWRKW